MSSRYQPTSSDDIARAKARERMAAYRKTPEYQDWLIRSRELRKGLKDKYRRQAGAKPRDLQAAAKKREQRSLARIQLEQVRRLHDAHVKRFKSVRKARMAYARRYARFADSERSRSSAAKHALVDSYVSYQLRQMGISADAINAELIELKREVIRFRRISREVKNLVCNYRKENHETVEEHA